MGEGTNIVIRTTRNMHVTTYLETSENEGFQLLDILVVNITSHPVLANDEISCVAKYHSRPAEDGRKKRGRDSACRKGTAAKRAAKVLVSRSICTRKDSCLSASLRWAAPRKTHGRSRALCQRRAAHFLLRPPQTAKAANTRYTSGTPTFVSRGPTGAGAKRTPASLPGGTPLVSPLRAFYFRGRGTSSRSCSRGLSFCPRTPLHLAQESHVSACPATKEEEKHLDLPVRSCRVICHCMWRRFRQ